MYSSFLLLIKLFGLLVYYFNDPKYAILDMNKNNWQVKSEMI